MLTAPYRRHHAPAAFGSPRAVAVMKNPTYASAFNLIEAINALLSCPELQTDDVAESTHELIDRVLEAKEEVWRECAFPEREEMIAFFARRLADEDRETLIKRIVALVRSFSDKELHASFEEARDQDAEPGSSQRQNPS